MISSHFIQPNIFVIRKDQFKLNQEAIFKPDGSFEDLDVFGLNYDCPTFPELPDYIRTIAGILNNDYAFIQVVH